ARRSSSPPAAPEWDQGPTTRGPSSLGTGTRGPAAPRAARPPWVPMETLTPSSQSTAGNGHQTNGATGEAPPGRTARRGIAESGGVWFGAVLAVVALVFAAVALVFDGDGGGGGGGAATAADTVTLELTEFALEPSSLTVPAGASIEVVNNGSVAHNVSIEGTDIMTSDLAAGGSETLDISSLEPGTYEILCTIAGHADAGMTGTLTVTEGGTGASGLAAASGDDAGDGDHAMHGGMTQEQMDEMSRLMNETMLEFPAETEGRGNQVLEPEVEADGTKVFELTAEIAEWEVEPGKVVEAWTFNGMVPGPQLHVDVG